MLVRQHNNINVDILLTVLWSHEIVPLLINKSCMFQRWFHDESGQALSEYGLLIALIIVAIAGAIALFRTRLIKAFSDATAAFDK